MPIHWFCLTLVSRATQRQPNLLLRTNRRPLAEAERRDALNAELRDAEMRLAQAPAISSADPQATTAAKLMNWLSAGLINVTTADIGMGRIALFTLLPQCAGLFLMLAMGLWQPGRRVGRP